MIEFNHTLFRFDMEIKKILCCDCVFDQIYFLMKEKKENLFETFDGERMFNIKEGQSPSIFLHVVDSK